MYTTEKKTREEENKQIKKSELVWWHKYTGELLTVAENRNK